MRNFLAPASWITATLVVVIAAFERPAVAQWKPVPLEQTNDSVAPWTGIVLWSDNQNSRTDAIQLEFSYLRYDQVVSDRGAYDWSAVDSVLDEVAGRSHQTILRFQFVHPGRSAAVPSYVKKLDDYDPVRGSSEGKLTEFVDWSHAGVEQFVLEFYSAFANRYDADPRLAYLETGFGLWGEYHIYDGPLTGAQTLGKTFPTRVFQKRFVQHLAKVFQQTPWMISIDAADSEYSPFASQPDLMKLEFGLFDDSFMCKTHPQENALNWRFFGESWKRSPVGGEFSYYTKRDQEQALASSGPHGRSFEDAATEFHVTFMIGNDQPGYQSMRRIREASVMTGYRLRVTKFEASESQFRVTVSNIGVAPLYHDAFVAVEGVRAKRSLRGLLPGESRIYWIAGRVRDGTKLTIESDRLVDGQRIPFEANLR